ncbi:metallophosphoesterase [Oscillospiraceae bacterium MB08-C2-2]|nr:metallophosphoesterase [Oscillospiraceae bacterium MB08-C2-2]
MRLAVFSDSHGRVSALREAFFQQPLADGYIFLGDGDGDWAEITASAKTDKRLVQVRGNCDWNPELKGTVYLNWGSVRILCTHGHLYHVKDSTYDLVAAARENNCQIALFGHTHQSLSTYENGIYLLNPGSVSRPREGDWPSYGIVDITDQGIFCNVVKLL